LQLIANATNTNMKKDPLHERSIIVSRPQKRPYGVRVQFRVQSLFAIGNLENVCIIMESGVFLTLSPGKTAPWEGGRRMELELEGFSTAAAAESSGERLVQALLWTAIKNKIALQLQYQSYEPAYVFERNRSSGISMSAYASVGTRPEKVVDSLYNTYSSLPVPDPSVLLSMEIFAGAKLETSERATYLAMVSALEPIAKAKPLGETVNIFVAKIIDDLNNTEDISQNLRNSLSGRIQQLCNESIRQSLKRFAKEVLPEMPNASSVIEEAYAIRSQIVHNGRPSDLDIDLNEKLHEIEEIILAIYEKSMGLTS
jgi:hypothetical protein